MCGISGIMALTDQPIPLDAALRMHQALAHRGPDGEGITLFPFEGIPKRVRSTELRRLSGSYWAVLSHQRLSILDTSIAGQQPMRSHSGRWWISFNGEIYNYLELKRLVPDHSWISSSDTEVLLELWERQGDKCLTSLIGMWAFALLSPQSRELVLCRDRFGIKPLYYTFVGDWIVFASEIRALFASGLVKKAWAKESVKYYLAYGVSTAGGKLTFYDGIYQVPPATLLRCHRGEVVEEVYYSIPKQPAMPLRELLEVAGSTFMDAVRIALRSDAPLALSLSGGVDSTNIAAASARWLRGKQQITAYTLDPSPLYESEVEFARDVAKRNGIQLRVVSLPAQLTLHQIADFVLTNEEPIGSPGSIVQYLLYSQIARDGIRVVLDGQGGDEAFAGYQWFYYPILCQIVRQHRYKELLPWLIGIVRNGNMNPLMIWLAGRQFINPYLRYDPEAASLLRSGRPLLPHCNYVLRTISSAHTWRERQWAAYQLELPLLLRDADRNGMRWSLEIRPPFLDHRIVELTHNADPLVLTYKGWSKYVARAMLDDDRVPPHIRWYRRKRGFYIQPNAFAAALEGVIPLLLPFTQELPEMIDISHLQKKLADKALSPYLVWRIFVLVLLDISPDLTKLSPETMTIIQEMPDFPLGRRPNNILSSIKGAVRVARKWLWSEAKWLADRRR